LLPKCLLLEKKMTGLVLLTQNSESPTVPVPERKNRGAAGCCSQAGSTSSMNGKTPAHHQAQNHKRKHGGSTLVLCPNYNWQPVAVITADGIFASSQIHLAAWVTTWLAASSSCNSLVADFGGRRAGTGPPKRIVLYLYGFEIIYYYLFYWGCHLGGG
jgi:hypothetical protein